MDLGLVGKAAIVTAASQGIGKGIAEELAKEGTNVTICGGRVFVTSQRGFRFQGKGHGVHTHE